MKNRLVDLNNHLFEAIERLADTDTTKEELAEQIEKSRMITIVADRIIDNARLVLAARKAISDGYIRQANNDPLIELLGDSQLIECNGKK